LVGERHPQSAPYALNQAAEYLAGRFAEYGWTTSGQPFRASGKSYFNIVATKAPSGRPAKDVPSPLLIGAHYDTLDTPGLNVIVPFFAILIRSILLVRKDRSFVSTVPTKLLSAPVAILPVVDQK